MFSVFVDEVGSTASPKRYWDSRRVSGEVAILSFLSEGQARYIYSIVLPKADGKAGGRLVAHYGWLKLEATAS